MTEFELIRDARQGERAAFGELVCRHEKKLLVLCWNMLGDRDEARDAAQVLVILLLLAIIRFSLLQNYKSIFSAGMILLISGGGIIMLQRRNEE